MDQKKLTMEIARRIIYSGREINIILKGCGYLPCRCQYDKCYPPQVPVSAMGTVGKW